jgi:hypothetical protein
MNLVPVIHFGDPMKNKQLLIPAMPALILIACISCMLFSPSSGALTLEPGRMPDAQVSVGYEAKIHVTQNRTPVGDFSLAKGALPAGLELIKVEGEEDTAKISGVPTQAGTFTFTVSVWCYGTNVSGQTGEMEYRIIVEE